MKVALVTKYFYPHSTGAAVYCHGLAKSLVERGHEVSVLFLKGNGDQKNLFRTLKFTNFSTPFGHWPMGIFVHLLKERYDIVHVHSVWEHVPITLAAAYLKRYPTILHPHGSWQFLDITSGKMKLLRCAWRLGAKCCRRVITLNDHESKLYATWGIDRSKLIKIPNAVNIDSFSKSSRPVMLKRLLKTDGPVVLFIGAMEKNKGIFTIIDSIPDVLKEISGTTFVFVGKGERHLFQKYAKRRGIDKACHFLGAYPNEKLPELYESADIFIAPSEFEAFGIVLIEAMACARPVISTRVAGPKEITTDGETGFLIEPGHHLQLAEKIRFLLQNKGVAKEMGQKARARVSALFTWDKVSREIERVYYTVRNENHRANT